ncbi:hypothetical protein BgiMline_032622 [Biomphalaria glabrata]|nr:hypothetical protein BgiMline_015634 [Biomphalaria glabrata]
MSHLAKITFLDFPNFPKTGKHVTRNTAIFNLQGRACSLDKIGLAALLSLAQPQATLPCLSGDLILTDRGSLPNESHKPKRQDS